MAPMLMIAATLSLSCSRAVFWSMVLFCFLACAFMAAGRVVRPKTAGLLLASALAALGLVLAAECTVYPGVLQAYAGRHTSQVRSTEGRRPAAGLVLEAPFTSLRAEADQALPVLGPLLLWGFDSKSRIVRVHAPLLIIHGDHDHTVPCRLGRELYEAAPGPKTLWTVPGADHNDLLEVAGPEYRERLRQFYTSLRLPANPAIAHQP